jgi:hypothetical protein
MRYDETKLKQLERVEIELKRERYKINYIFQGLKQKNRMTRRILVAKRLEPGVLGVKEARLGYFVGCGIKPGGHVRNR